MWGRAKKQALVEADKKGKFCSEILNFCLRYIGDMSSHQQEVLDQFKKWIEDNNITENPWHKDYFLLKFCRARKFDLDKIIEMFTNYMAYRKENGLDTII